MTSRGGRAVGGAAAPRAQPLWGGGFLVSMLSLIGMAPLAIFMSEFQILRAAVSTGAIAAAVIFLAGTGVVFVGALRHAGRVAWGTPTIEARPEKTGFLDAGIVIVLVAAILTLGLWMPRPLWQFIQSAAAIVGGGA